MVDAVITANGLTKYFGKHCAVDRVSFGVPRGSVTAFLGRNGSGKTTTLRMLLGLIEPTRGTSKVLGVDSRELTPEVRGRVGYLAENHPVIGWMTVKQAGKYQAAFYPKWNGKIFEATVAHFGLRGDAKAGSLSRGQRAGLALGLTLATEPEVLVLDDPALGLDPVARRALLEAILYITRTPERTVLLSSHLLDDIERVADYLLILDRSVLRAACRMEEFRERIAQYHLTFAGAPPALPEIRGLLDTLRVNNTLRITVANPGEGLEGELRRMRPVHLERQAVDFADAVTAYMSDHRSRSFFLEQLGGAA
ncbi:MAG: ABC transporter ATP-binding protein [Phycisphaerae bacterium]